MLQYSDREYWNERYTKSSGSSFDWYQRYDTLRHLIIPLIAKDATVLQVSPVLSRGSGDPLSQRIFLVLLFYTKAAVMCAGRSWEFQAAD